MSNEISDDEQRSNSVRLNPEVADKWYYPLLAPFSSHYSMKEVILRAPLSTRIVLEQAASTESPALFFIKNAKAACSTVSQAMYFLSSGQECSYIHGEKTVLSQGSRSWRVSLERSSSTEYTRFTFVRHPIDRLESSFKDFVLEGRNGSRKNHLQGFAEFGCHPDKSTNENLDAFLDYVESSLELSRPRTDPHWRLQIDNIGLGLFDYDFIGRVENLEDDMRKIFTVAGADQAAIEQAVAIHSNRSRTSGRIANDAQSARIRRLYAKDFEAFNYE